MAKKAAAIGGTISASPKSKTAAEKSGTTAKPETRGTRLSVLLDTRVVNCGDNLEQLAKLPDACVDLIYIDPPFNSNRNHAVFWGETKEKRAFEDRRENTKAYIDYMRPRCVQLARVLKKTGSFYYHYERVHSPCKGGAIMECGCHRLQIAELMMQRRWNGGLIALAGS
jgi:hypothetical protein